MERERPLVATLIIITLLAALPRVTASIYTPSMPSLVAHFDSTITEVKFTFTIYIFGLAVGHLFYGPLSDRYGRRPVLVTGLVLFILMSVACALAPTVEMLTLGRFFQAFSAAAAGVLARAIVRDLFGPDRTAQAFAYVAMATTLSPALGPIIGGQIQDLAGWQAVFVTLGFVGLGLLAFTFLRLPETRPVSDLTPTSAGDMARAFGRLMCSRTFMGYSLNSAFILSAMLSFFGTAPFLLIGSLGLSPRAYGFYTGITVIGYIIGNFVATRMPGHQDIERFVRLGSAIAVAGAGSMLVLALTGPLGIFAVIGPFTLTSVGAGIALPASFAGSTNRYPQIAGTSSALAGFLNMLIASAAAACLAFMSTATAVPLAGFMAALTLLALVTGMVLRKGEDQV